MLSFSNQMYTLDFARMLQINQITKVERPIRALPINVAPAKDILAIRKLLEYFLSDENLVEDADLRDKLMQAPDGWLSLNVLVNKDRMKKLKATLPDLELAARDLKILETRVSLICEIYLSNPSLHNFSFQLMSHCSLPPRGRFLLYLRLPFPQFISLSHPLLVTSMSARVLLLGCVCQARRPSPCPLSLTPPLLMLPSIFRPALLFARGAGRSPALLRLARPASGEQLSQPPRREPPPRSRPQGPTVRRSAHWQESCTLRLCTGRRARRRHGAA